MKGSIEVSCCSTDSVLVASSLKPSSPALSLAPSAVSGNFQSTERSTPVSLNADRLVDGVCTPVTPKLLGSRVNSWQNRLLGSNVGLELSWLKQRPTTELVVSDEMMSSIL